MAYDKSSLDDYVDVATRIAEFRAKYPDGYLAPLDRGQPFRLVQVEGWETPGKSIERTFVVVVAAAYRSPDDTAPGVGMAWEPFPGRTPYTRDSELMNAETSAWGRAIIALGAADAKRGISSLEEVRNRQDNPFDGDQASRGSNWQAPAQPNSHDKQHHNARNGPLPDDQWTTTPADENTPGTSTPEQWQKIAIRCGERGLTTREDKLAFCVEAAKISRPIASSKDLSFNEAAEILAVASA